MDIISSTKFRHKCYECDEFSDPVVRVCDDANEDPVYLCLECVERALRCLEAATIRGGE